MIKDIRTARISEIPVLYLQILFNRHHPALMRLMDREERDYALGKSKRVGKAAQTMRSQRVFTSLL